MTPKRTKKVGGKAHRFGGDWTTAKLDVLAKYLASYTTALKDKPSKEHPFRKATSTRSLAPATAMRDAMMAGRRRRRCCFQTSRRKSRRPSSTDRRASR